MTLQLKLRDEREEGRKEGRIEGKKEGIEEGKISLLLSLVNKKMLSVQQAALEAGVSEKVFSEMLTV